MTLVVGLLLSLSSPSPVRAVSLFGEASSNLKRLPLLKRVLYLVQENYVDPKRIDAGVMFVSALKRLQAQIPEVRVLSPDSSSVILMVNRQRLRLSKDIISLYSLTPALSKSLLFVKQHMITPISDEDLQYLCIQGVLETLDPHSIFLNRELWQEAQIDTKGSFGGVGVVIGIRDGKLTIITAMEGSPGAAAGLQANDVIQKIDDVSTINMNTFEAANLMRGKPGDEVVLTFMRQGFVEPRTVKVVRAIIKTTSAEFHRLKDNIQYIRLRNFQSNTTADVRRFLEETAKSGLPSKGVIIDLRNNPGGLYKEAIGLADLFVSKGSIVSTVARGNKEKRRERANVKETFVDIPLVILVNSGSASASEIVAGAIKYLDRGVVVGSRTFGKGSVNILYELPGETALKLTVEKYLTSNDSSIQSIGIAPDIRLNPARVDDERVSLFTSSLHRGEKDLDGHFEFDGDRFAQEMPSTYSVRYLAGKDNGQASFFDKKKEPLKDPEIAFAWKMLKRTRYNSRKKMLKELRAIVKQETTLQAKRIAVALGQRGIQWAHTLPKEPQRGCAPPFVRAEVSAADKTVRAGKKAQLTLHVDNRGDCALTNFWALSQSDDFFLNRREFLFGKIAPKDKKSFSVEFRLPEYTPDRLSRVAFRFFEDEKEYPLEKHHNFAISGIDQPKFSYLYRINDNDIAESHRSDGLVQRGENIQFRVFVKNSGAGTSKENIVTLKNLSGSGISLNKGREPLGELGPGQTKEVIFDFDVRDYYKRDEIEVELTVFDSQFAQFVNKKLQIPVHPPALQEAAVANPQWLRTQPDKSVDVYSGLSLDSPRVGRIAANSAVRVAKEWGDFYLVNIDESTEFCRQGWVQKQTLVAPEKPKSVTATAKNYSCAWNEPPSLLLSQEFKPKSVAQSRLFTLKGKVQDDQDVKDLYITVNDEKAFYQAFDANKLAKEGAFEAILPLKKGTNSIYIIARDGQDLIDQQRLIILYRPEEAQFKKISLAQ